MSVRRCKCGCRVSLDGRRKGTVWATESCRSAFRAGEAPVQRGKRYPGGLQVSYRKVAEALAKRYYVEGHEDDAPEWNASVLEWALGVIAEALPARQRARLEARR